MKLIIFTVLLSMASVAQAETGDVCFKSKGSKIGQVSLTRTHVYLDNDMSTSAGYTKASGFIDDLQQKGSATVVQAYLMGVGDGSNFEIVIAPEFVSLQNIDDDGTPNGKATFMPVIACK